MAKADYRCCDVCDSKVFYDSYLNYEQGPPEYAPERPPFRVAGKHEAWATPEAQHKYGTRLDYLGDWAVLCEDCAKTHRTAILPIDAPPPAADEIARITAERDALAADARRYRWLRERMGWYSTADSPGGPALASVCEVIWYHATDDTQSRTLDELIDDALDGAKGEA